jgi:hypothetical protein
MMTKGPTALDMLQQQIAELDQLLADARKHLNTVAAGEKLVKWKARVVPLIAQHLGPEEGRRFSETKPGPSFSNDLLEELSDDVELYRDYLVALADRVRKDGHAGAAP